MISLGHPESMPGTMEPPVLQGSNLEMVDRGLFDYIPDILEKLETPMYYTVIAKSLLYLL